MRRSSFARIATETTGYASSCLFNQSNWVSRTTYTNCGVQNLRERVIGMDILQYQYQLQQLTPVSISIPTQIPRCNQLEMKVALWVHGWKLKPNSTDGLSIHSCICRSTFLNARDPKFLMGARWHSWRARAVVVNFRQPHASKASRTPATIPILFGIEAPPPAQPPRLPTAQDADLGWKLDPRHEWERGMAFEEWD